MLPWPPLSSGSSPQLTDLPWGQLAMTHPQPQNPCLICTLPCRRTGVSPAPGDADTLPHPHQAGPQADTCAMGSSARPLPHRELLAFPPLQLLPSFFLLRLMGDMRDN